MSTLSLHNTADWDYNDLDWPNIMAAIRRFVEEYPNEASMESLVQELMFGKKQLWVVRNEEDVTVSVVLVEFETVLSTGHCRCIVYAFAGDRGVEALPMLSQLEEYAKRYGAEEMRIFGRRGWKRLLEPQGYGEHAVVLSKDL